LGHAQSSRTDGAVDNFSEFDTFGVNLDKLTDNLSNFGLQEVSAIKILKNF